jgi:CheY-like chemotaxis protein
VLVVDDEAEIRDDADRDPDRRAHRVVAVASGREALQRLAAGHYDVIFTDMRMPEPRRPRALPRDRAALARPGRARRFVTGDTLTANLRDFVKDDGRPVIRRSRS